MAQYSAIYGTTLDQFSWFGGQSIQQLLSSLTQGSQSENRKPIGQGPRDAWKKEVLDCHHYSHFFQILDTSL